MSDGEFLSPDEVQRLTGQRSRAKQAAPRLDGGDDARWRRHRQGEEWKCYLLMPDLEIVKAGTYHPDLLGGIYGLFSHDGALLYIGRSYSIGTRVIQHMHAAANGKRERFATYSAVDVPGWLMAPLETAHIHALDPPGNQYMPRADWAHHDEAVELIRQAWGEKR